MSSIKPTEFKRRGRYTLDEKKAILREYLDGGVPIAVLARKYNVNPVTVYIWKKMIANKDERMNAPLLPEEVLKEIQRLKNENSKLKHAVAELTLDKECQKEIIETFKKKQLEKAVGKLRKKS